MVAMKIYSIQTLFTMESIRWLYSRNKSSHISSIYSQCHVILLKFTEQNVNNQSLTTLYSPFLLS